VAYRESGGVGKEVRAFVKEKEKKPVSTWGIWESRGGSLGFTVRRGVSDYIQKREKKSS